jgi:nucleoside-diphosphate-sugar epimerase
MPQSKALVAGALGIVGSNIASHLSALGWKVTGISRSQPVQQPGYELARLDLADAAACRELVAAQSDTTHLFFAARATDANPAVEARVNLAMLANLLQPLHERAPGFAHVCLVHGSKWYGAHLGPYRTPAKEDDPRHLAPNFYFDQLDYAAELQRGQRWTWSTLRPALVCGYSLGYPHNIIAAIGTYAAISKALGLPLRFPGTQACFEAVCQATDAGLLARSMAWAATEPGCANQSFNIVNGDLFRWRHVWEKLARYFGMENGGVQTISLVKLMADKEPLWRTLAERHGLRPLALAEIANWDYADMSFRQDWDQITSTIKSRRFGFQECIDTEDMFIDQLERFRGERVIP